MVLDLTFFINWWYLARKAKLFLSGDISFAKIFHLPGRIYIFKRKAILFIISDRSFLIIFNNSFIPSYEHPLFFANKQLFRNLFEVVQTVTVNSSIIVSFTYLIQLILFVVFATVGIFDGLFEVGVFGLNEKLEIVAASSHSVPLQCFESWLYIALLYIKKMLLSTFSMALIIFYIPESADLTNVLLFLIKLFSLSILPLWSDPTADPSKDFFLSFSSYFLRR